MNSLKILIAAVVLLIATGALAQNVPPSTTFEVPIKEFRLAESQQGTVGLRQCEDCDYHRLRVTLRTQYMVDGRHLRFDDFRNALASFRASGGDIVVNVKRDDTSGTVASVFIYSE